MSCIDSATRSSARPLLPADFGALVRATRKAKGAVWTQGFLAARVGVTRECIARLEAGTPGSGKMPGWRLVEALVRELGPASLELYVDAPDPARSDRGFRASAARRTAGLTLVEVARSAHLSPASLSMFERGAASPRAIVGCRGKDDGRGVRSLAYARALGFLGPRHMTAYLKADDPLPYLTRIARKHGRRLPPMATLPAKRLPLPDQMLSAIESDLMSCL